MGTNWNTGNSIWIWEKTSLLWRWQTPGAAVQRHCGVSFSEVIQNPPGHHPVQPGLDDPAMAGVLDWMDSRGHFQSHLWLKSLPNTQKQVEISPLSCECAASPLRELLPWWQKLQGWGKAEEGWMFLLPSKNGSGYPWADKPFTYYSFSKAGWQPMIVDHEQLENSCMRGLVFPKSRKRWWGWW